VSGADLERVSTRDFQRYDDSGVNWRVIDGYGAVIAAHGEGLPIVFGSPARHIDHSGRRLRVDIADGTGGDNARGDARPSLGNFQGCLFQAPSLRRSPSVPRRAGRGGGRSPVLRFVTHHHADHNIECGPLLIVGWIQGLPLDVRAFGPPPLKQMTDDFMRAYKRTVDFWAEDFHMKPLTSVNVQEISAAGLVTQDDNVKVSAILVEHPPVKPALGYRFDFKGTVSQVIGFIKGKSAIHLARVYGEKKRNFVGQHFWARGYFVSTVGRDTEVIREYIKKQEEEDKRLEQMNLWR
jgi:hypothetical protein